MGRWASENNKHSSKGYEKRSKSGGRGGDGVEGGGWSGGGLMGSAPCALYPCRVAVT